MMDSAQIMLWSLIFMRMSGFILLNPILGRKTIPIYIKSGFIMVLTYAIFSFSNDYVLQLEISTAVEYSFLLMKEFVVGYILGFIMELFLLIVIYAGGIIDFQIGLSMATVFDAQSNASLPVMGSLYNVYFILLFFAVDGHLGLMKIIITASDIIPYGTIVLGPNVAMAVLDIFIQCILLAVKFSFPLLAMEFLVEIGVGVLMKAIPQINIFVVNIQAKLIVGFIVLIVLFSPMSDFLGDAINQMLRSLQDVLQLI